MKFCISNLAWTKKETKEALILLKKRKIRLLEYSPNLLFDNYNSKKEIKIVKKYWLQNNIKLYSMQTVLHGVNNAFLSRKTRYLRLERAARCALVSEKSWF